MERKRLTERAYYDRDIVKLKEFEPMRDYLEFSNINAYTAYRNVLNRLAEYEDAEEAGLIKRLPCKVGTTIYYIRKDCDANDGYREEFRPTKEFEEDCEHFEDQYWESPEYCKYFDIVDNDYRGYEDCSFDLKIICDKCKDRLTIHKDYFTLSKINQIYGTEQFNPNTPLEDTYFLTIPEAKEKIEELKNEKI